MNKNELKILQFNANGLGKAKIHELGNFLTDEHIHVGLIQETIWNKDKDVSASFPGYTSYTCNCTYKCQDILTLIRNSLSAEVSNVVDLPDRRRVIVHEILDSDEEVKGRGEIERIEILESEYKKGPFKAILHCFSSGKELALCGLELGFYISFSGIVTFKSAKLIQEIATIVPEDKILVETDAPYLSPTPLRGSINEPKNCLITAKYLAEIRKCEFSIFVDQLYMNSFKIFDKII